jgi:hypothetical protein
MQCAEEKTEEKTCSARGGKDMQCADRLRSPLLRAAGELVDWKNIMRLGTALQSRRSRINRTSSRAGLISRDLAQIVVRYR